MANQIPLLGVAGPPVAAGGGGPTYQGATICPGSVDADNNLIDLAFNENLATDSDYKTGWTHQVRAPGGDDTAWKTLTSSTYTMALEGTDKIRITLTGTVTEMHKSMQFRTSYSDSAGGIKSAVDSEQLGDITNDSTLTNNATIDIYDGMRGAWGLDGATGATETDYWAGHDLTDVGSVVSVAGAVGNAKDFSPADRLYVADHADFDSGAYDYMIGFWFNADALGTGVIVARYGSSGNRTFTIDTSGDVLRFRIRDSVTALRTHNHSTTLSADTWYFATCWYDHSALTINSRVNGVTGTPESTVNAISTNSYDVEIGSDEGGTSFFDGTIDDVWIRTNYTVDNPDALHDAIRAGGSGAPIPWLPDNDG